MCGPSLCVTGRFTSCADHYMSMHQANGNTVWTVNLPTAISSVGSVRVANGADPMVYMVGSFAGTAIDFGDGVMATSAGAGRYAHRLVDA
jgi:hypothetical protein